MLEGSDVMGLGVLNRHILPQRLFLVFKFFDNRHVTRLSVLLFSLHDILFKADIIIRIYLITFSNPLYKINLRCTIKGQKIMTIKCLSTENNYIPTKQPLHYKIIQKLNQILCVAK